VVEMPKAEFIISGEIDDFSRIDNVYNTLKREGAKLFVNWEIKVTAEYSETQAGVVKAP